MNYNMTGSLVRKGGWNETNSTNKSSKPNKKNPNILNVCENINQEYQNIDESDR